ncbi:29569_t:CDS:2 [Racocetra persica]|uniref:29569_t:CDS:1 n=1 Tax=Racocetra persica TaxID=160502 RepID=A0ACA9RY35_9GLOM|nr:29569_t:CDS:2 [Racocetra persica]
MPSHIALLVVVTAVRTNSICSYGHAKYKLTEQTSRTIRWKYFFSTNSPSQLFAPGDLVFISGRCVVENSEQCVTIAYASIIDNNSSREFDLTGVPICISHCMVFVLVNHNQKQTKEFIHFGVETVEYNAVTGFKHLGTSGSNIKVGNTYLISGLFKFSDSGKIMIEASDINFSKLPPLNLMLPKISSSMSSTTRSIIDIIADDIDSNTDQSFTKPSSIRHDNILASSSSATLSASTAADIEINSSVEKNNYINLNAEDNNCECDSDHKYDENEDLEDDQPKKRKRSARINKKDKGKEYYEK